MREVFGSRLATGSSARITTGSLRQRAGDADALLLAAGELIGARDAPCASSSTRSQALHRDLDVARRKQLQQGEHRRQAGHPADQHVLQHRSAAAPDCGAGRSSRRARPLASPASLGMVLLAVDHDRVRVGAHEAVDAAEHRRLAGAAWAQHDEKFARPNREVDAVEDRCARRRTCLSPSIVIIRASRAFAPSAHFIFDRSSFSAFAVSRMTS